MNKFERSKRMEEIIKVCGESEYSKYRVRLNFLKEDKQFYSGHLHELVGLETLFTLSFSQGGGTFKMIECPHCKAVGSVWINYNFMNTQSKIWCRSCDKTSVYKYKL